MFGTLKENILKNLEETYTTDDEKVFKKEFHKFIKLIKENKSLKEYYEVYDLFNQVNFDDQTIAREFVEESIAYLKTFDKKEIDKLKEIAIKNKLKLNENSIEYKLDELVFNDRINLKDKATYKINLINQLTNKDKQVVNYKDSFNVLNTKINENVKALTEDQTKVLDLFIENDSKNISEFYTNLINETTDIVDKKILTSENIDIAKKLLEVKIRLNDLKTQTPNITEIEKIIDLKESFK